MKILFLSRWFPVPVDNGSKLRIYNLLRRLQRHHSVILLSFVEEGNEPLVGHQQLDELCSEYYTVPWKPFRPDSWRAFLGYFSRSPRSIVDTYSFPMEKTIRSILNSYSVDMIIASQWPMAAYARAFDGYPALYEEVELGVLYDRVSSSENTRDRLRFGLMWLKQVRYLRRILSSFSAGTVVSNQELEILRRAVPELPMIQVIPNCIDLNSYQNVKREAEENTIIFTGSLTYAPNYYGVCWFLKEVFPLIQRRCPKAQLVVTGDHGNLELPISGNVTLTGFVPDIRPLLANARVSIVPVMTGGGTRLKILEAMALRTPVVSTTKGAEGLHSQNGVHAILADEPQAFANAVIDLLTHDSLHAYLVDQAYKLVDEAYDWDRVFPEFLTLLENIR